jgi:hypothetical protein
MNSKELNNIQTVTPDDHVHTIRGAKPTSSHEIDPLQDLLMACHRVRHRQPIIALMFGAVRPNRNPLHNKKAWQIPIAIQTLAKSRHFSPGTFVASK